MVLLERWRAARHRERERERERESNRRATTTIAIGSVCFPAIQWRKDCRTHLPKDSVEPISQSLLPINALELGSSSYPGAAKLQLLVSCFRSSLCLYLLSSFSFLFFLVSHVSIESSIILVLQSLSPLLLLSPHHHQQQKLQQLLNSCFSKPCGCPCCVFVGLGNWVFFGF
jgi:hypothetical protein